MLPFVPFVSLKGYSEDILAEYAEKLAFLGVLKEIVLELLEDFARNGRSNFVTVITQTHFQQ